jgi:hypothetical protein
MKMEPIFFKGRVSVIGIPMRVVIFRWILHGIKIFFRIGDRPK